MSESLRDELIAEILLLTAEPCPFDQTNPTYCPLYLARLQGVEETAKWLHALELSDLQLLVRHHEICLQVRTSDEVKL